MVKINREEMEGLVSLLVESDEAFSFIVEESPLCEIGSKNYYRSGLECLISIVISQQLSTKVAYKISERINFLVKGDYCADSLGGVTDDELRNIGLSRSKIRSIREILEEVVSSRLDLENLFALSNSLVYDKLISIYGIGRWSVEMFLIFYLGRLDVFPVGDLVVRRGWSKIHGLDYVIGEDELKGKLNHLKSLESVAAWYCWRAVEGESGLW